MLSATVLMVIAGWILEEAAKHKFIKGIVAGLDLTSPKVKLLLIGGTALCPLAKHFIHFIELVQPRNTCPDVTEKLLTGT